MPANGGSEWRKFTKLLKVAGWKREDMYYWKHPDGGRFMPWNQHYKVVEWRQWADKGQAPPGDYGSLISVEDAIRTVTDG